jgi:hypothetical protein
MDETRLGLLTFALASALGAGVLASGPGTAGTTAPVAEATTPVATRATEATTAVSQTATASGPANDTRPGPASAREGSLSTASTASLTGTVPVTAVPWGAAFERYLKLLEDADASMEALEKARAEFESGLGQSTGPASASSAASSPGTSRTSS